MWGMLREEQQDLTRIGDYTVLAKIAEGGQWVVYLATDPTGRHVAVKVLHPRRLADPAMRRCQEREVLIAQKVAPFCAVAVIDADLDADPPFIVSEFVEGATLKEHLMLSGPMVGSVLVRFAVGTVTALAAIHRVQIVHRDLTPRNIILGPDGPRVIDFGIAEECKSTGSIAGLAQGDPAFMAPEQISGGPVNCSADLFSWASTMVFAATGVNPFGSGTVVEIVRQIHHGRPALSGVPLGLQPLLKRCLDKNPENRPSAEQALLDLLGVSVDPDPVLKGMPIPRSRDGGHTKKPVLMSA